MLHYGNIAEKEVASESDFILYGPAVGLVGEYETFEEAKHQLRSELAETRANNVPSECSIFKWCGDSWSPAISLYDLQEWELESNPTQLIHYP